MSTPPLIACLCAQWCGVCRTYRATFEGLAAHFPHQNARYLWLDVEEHAALLHPLDEVENFPTLLLAAEGQARFFGAVDPSLGTLVRLVRTYVFPAAQANAKLAAPLPPPLKDEAVQALVQRLNRLKSL